MKPLWIYISNNFNHLLSRIWMKKLKFWQEICTFIIRFHVDFEIKFPSRLTAHFKNSKKSNQKWQKIDKKFLFQHFSFFRTLCKDINMSKYDAIRSIRMYTPSKETLKFMANRIKKLEHLEIEMGFQPQELLSKEWHKAFCDFLKSQENTLTEITFLFPYCHYCFGFLMSM